jgi:hypothetical protein
MFRPSTQKDNSNITNQMLLFILALFQPMKPTSGGGSVGIVRSRTQTMEFFFFSANEDSVNNNI